MEPEQPPPSAAKLFWVGTIIRLITSRDSAEHCMAHAKKQYIFTLYSYLLETKTYTACRTTSDHANRDESSINQASLEPAGDRHCRLPILDQQDEFALKNSRRPFISRSDRRRRSIMGGDCNR
jgi:hypothetical protein